MPAGGEHRRGQLSLRQAPRDGTVFGSFSRNVPSQALMGQTNVEADPRQFNWLGATSLPGRVCVRLASPRRSRPGRPLHPRIHRRRRGRRLLAQHPADRVQPRARHQIPHHPGLQGHAPTSSSRSSAARCRAPAPRYGQFRIYEQLFRDGKLLFILRAEEDADPGNSRRAIDLRLRQDRRTAPAHAVRVFEHRVRAPLRAAARTYRRTASRSMRKAFAETPATIPT